MATSIQSPALFGTCDDTCFGACALASETQRSDHLAGTLLIVGLLLFLSIDAMIACIAIYGAGRKRPCQVKLSENRKVGTSPLDPLIFRVTGAALRT